MAGDGCGSSPPAPKACGRCGREIRWRRKWAVDWERVRYCSERCRRRRLDGLDRDLERTIRDLLAARGARGSLCPSEAARRLATERGTPDRWRAWLEATRSAARRLVAAGAAEITQGGRPVDPSTARGPIRIRRVRG